MWAPGVLAVSVLQPDRTLESQYINYWARWFKKDFVVFSQTCGKLGGVVSPEKGRGPSIKAINIKF